MTHRDHTVGGTSWAPWVVVGTAVALSGILATGLIRSWVDDWAYVDPYPKFEVYSSWALVVGFGAGLVYLLVWVAFPSLPPYDYEGGLSILPVGSHPSLLADPCRTGASAEAAMGSIDAAAVAALPMGESEGVRVKPVGTSLLHVLDGSVRSGAFLTEVTEREPVLVLGATAAGWLGVAVGSRLRVGEHWFRVEGILDLLGSLHADVDESALVGLPAAEALLGFGARPDTLYVRRPVVALAEGRVDRLWRGLRVGVACSVMIAIALLAVLRALNPCDPRFTAGVRCGDPPLEEEASG